MCRNIYYKFILVTFEFSSFFLLEVMASNIIELTFVFGLNFCRYVM